VTLAEGAIERLPDSLHRDAPQDHGDAVLAELLLESHRVTGVVEQASGHRRLVDFLNNTDAVLTLRDAAVQSVADPNGQPRRCPVLQVRRQSILLAVPVRGLTPSGGGLEVVEKRPTLASILLPGIEVTGQIYLPPGADPGTVSLLGRHDFLPVTEAAVTQSAYAIVRWETPLVLVNLERALVYAPAPE